MVSEDTGPSAVTGVILAGGRGSRMGEQDKGLMLLAGRPLVEHVLDALRPQVGAIMISANRNLERYRSLGFHVVRDAQPGFQGPLAGIASALSAIDTPLAAFVPCDGPLLPDDLVARLRHALAQARAEVALPHDGERIQPAFALMRSDLREALTEAVRGGERRLGYWLQSRRVVEVDFRDRPGAFANVNTPTDLDQLARTLAARKR
ncbi:molybdenum cofactor guanylyltransferase [Ectothiorhodospiraceae bacterium WFHF3C12]|nr:molybdenum cofactor guanylyltransferase [Ectothiorhodospiraceae bacterium WFHF3C12]